jgi:hypothetical protein
MKTIFCFMLLSALVIAAQPDAGAMTTDALRCDGGLISIGDIAPDVIRKCGEPAYATQREQKFVEGDIPGERIVTTVVIDDWTFNFGPNKFQHRILLRNNKVWRIEVLDYGY